MVWTSSPRGASCPRRNPIRKPDAKTAYHDVQDLPSPVIAEQGLILPEGLSKEAWAELFQRVVRAHKQIYWMIGDAMLYGERLYGKDWVEQYVPHGPIYHNFLRYKRVARRIPPEMRRVELSFLHHDIVCTFTPEVEWEDLLQECVDKDYNTKALKTLVCERYPNVQNKKNVRGRLIPGYLYIDQKAEQMTKDELETTMKKLQRILAKKDL